MTPHPQAAAAAEDYLKEQVYNEPAMDPAAQLVCKDDFIAGWMKRDHCRPEVSADVKERAEAFAWELIESGGAQGIRGGLAYLPVRAGYLAGASEQAQRVKELEEEVCAFAEWAPSHGYIWDIELNMWTKRATLSEARLWQTEDLLYLFRKETGR